MVTGEFADRASRTLNGTDDVFVPGFGLIPLPDDVDEAPHLQAVGRECLLNLGFRLSAGGVILYTGLVLIKDHLSVIDGELIASELVSLSPYFPRR